jgi:beta-lactamase regulating signal transducer with metallopeptidase domain
MSAFSIFSFSFIAGSINSEIANQDDNSILNQDIHNDLSLLIVTGIENDFEKDISLTEEIIINTSITNYNFIDRDYISNNSFDSMKNNNYYSDLTKKNEPNFLKLTQNANNSISRFIKNFIANYSLISHKNGLNNDHYQTLSSSIQNIENEESDNGNLGFISLFLLFNIFLIVICGFYLTFSITLGKKYTLKSLNAKKCQNPEILKIIKNLSNELRMKTPKIFIFDGDANAFVFGFPASLAISKNLIKCLSKEEFLMTIRHELGHIKNRDIIIKPLLQSIRILFFYNPFVHFIYYKLIKQRELMADALFIKTKKDKITFMDALVKIYEYTKNNNTLSYHIYQSFSLSFLNNSKKLEINDRFNHIFKKKVKKTFYSIIICIIILLTNLSLIVVAQNIVVNTNNGIDKNEMIEIVEVNPKSNYYQYLLKNFLTSRNYPYIDREYKLYIIQYLCGYNDNKIKDII